MNKLLIPKLKDVLVLSGWIAGLLFLSGICWSLTGPLRTDLLRQSINRAWTRTGVTYQLAAPVAPGTLKPGISRLGTWYVMEGGKRVLVFTIISDGLFLPCAAVVNSGGKVEELLALTGRGESLLKNISPGIIRLHIRRIEGTS